MEDFIAKKQEVVEALNNYILEELSQEEFLEKINVFVQDSTIMSVDLFKSILNELKSSLSELSRKELKQRKLMLEGYIY